MTTLTRPGIGLDPAGNVRPLSPNYEGRARGGHPSRSGAAACATRHNQWPDALLLGVR
jgi:hypothetical protein